MGAAGAAAVSHGGQRRAITAGESLTFGRSSSCNIVLDQHDLGISRLAGSVEEEAGTWWLTNRSTARPLTVVDELGMRTVVPPGRRLALTGALTVIVEGSTLRHAIEVEVEGPAGPPGPGPDLTAGDGALPTSIGEGVVINEADRLALVALFSGYLEPFPRYDPHPRSYADAAAALGWPRTTLVKRVEYLRTRLTNSGVPNLLGEAALSHLAEWVLTTGVLSRDDLALLRPPASPPVGR